MNRDLPILKYPLEPSTLKEWSRDGRYNPAILESDMMIVEPVLDYWERRN